MNRLTADDNLQRSLDELEGLTEIRDPQGKVIGYFTPAAGDKTAAIYSQAAAHFDANEMKRRKESGETGLTTAEVLDHLKSLEE